MLLHGHNLYPDVTVRKVRYRAGSKYQACTFGLLSGMARTDVSQLGSEHSSLINVRVKVNYGVPM